MNTNDQPATPSADEESATPRIYTKCPACRNDTLTINADKHLICTWISCPDPTLIDRISEVFPHKWEEAQRELASLQSARVEEIEEAKAVGAALFDQCESLRATLAERDAELAKKQSLIETACRDWADDDTRIKEMVKRLIPSADVEGDSHGVPSILDCGDMLCNEITSLRAQLAETQEAARDLNAAAIHWERKFNETQEKLKEAEAAHDQLTERYKTTHDHWIAAEERWKQVQQTLIRVQAEYAEREESQPDLPLIEEVRKELVEIQETASAIHAVINREDCPKDDLWIPTIECHATVIKQDAKLLLTRLNPRT